MNNTFSSKLIIKNEFKLYQALEPEKKDLITKRAKVDIKLSDLDVIINIEATDFTSYRAMESAIMRLLITYHKMKVI